MCFNASDYVGVVAFYHTARSEILFLMLQKFITIVFMDCLLVLVGARQVCFLVLSVLPLPDFVLFKLLFLVLSLCLYGEDVARGGLSGSLQSEVEMSDRTEKLFVSSMVEFEKSELAKLGMQNWQQIHQTWLFWRALYAIVDIPMSIDHKYGIQTIAGYAPASSIAN